MLIDSLKGFRIVGVCAGHRHSMVLDEHGFLYTFGSGASGALGHGDLVGQEYPMKVMEFGKLFVDSSDIACKYQYSTAFV